MSNPCPHKVVGLHDVIIDKFRILRWMCEWCGQEFKPVEEEKVCKE